MRKYKGISLCIVFIYVLSLFNAVYAEGPIYTPKVVKMTDTSTKKVYYAANLIDSYKAMGAMIFYDENTNTYTITKDRTTITIKIGSSSAILNKKQIKLEYPAKVDSQKAAYLPVSFIAATDINFGYEFKWDEAKKLLIGEKIIKEVKCSITSATIIEGKSLQLKLTANYIDGSTVDITALAEYKSDNDEIVSARKGSKKGELTAISIGNANVTIIYKKFEFNIPVRVTIDEYSYGNTLSNTSNKGKVVTNNELIYYSNPADEGKLYTTAMNGLSSKKLHDDKVSYLNASRGWIYYSNLSDEGRLYKLKKFGNERVKLTDNKADYINIIGEWIYYSNTSDIGKIYKTKTDGSQNQKLNEDQSIGINVANGYVFYTNFNDGKKLYRMKTDGTERKKLGEDEALNITVYDGWVYYTNNSDRGCLYKMSIDGAENIRLNNEQTESINVHQDWVYYSNFKDGRKLYKVKIDGTGRTLISQEIASNINIIGGWVYFINQGVNGERMQRVKPDGSQLQTVFSK